MSDSSCPIAFHDDLDFVSIHNELRAGFNNLLEHLRGRQSLETQTDAVVKAEAAGLADRPALTLVRSRFIGPVIRIKVEYVGFQRFRTKSIARESTSSRRCGGCSLFEGQQYNT